MKAPWQWTEEDLLALIEAGVKESIELDYKGCGALENAENKKIEISKDVSAFANSAGGTIVYGIIENGYVPVALDQGFDRMTITKEWLEQIINSRIQRRIGGIRVNEVDLTTTNPGRVAFVVHIPQSSHAPHQAFDKRFYKRVNFASVPMEEYEVRDVSRRLEAPDLELTCQIKTDEPALRLEPSQTHLSQLCLGFSLTNHSITPARHAIIELHIDERLQIRAEHFNYRTTSTLAVHDKPCPCTRLSKYIGSDPANLPIFQSVRWNIPDRPLVVAMPPDAGDFVIAWQLKAPYMSSKFVAAMLRWDGQTARISPMSPDEA